MSIVAYVTPFWRTIFFISGHPGSNRASGRDKFYHLTTCYRSYSSPAFDNELNISKAGYYTNVCTGSLRLFALPLKLFGNPFKRRAERMTFHIYQY